MIFLSHDLQLSQFSPIIIALGCDGSEYGRIIFSDSVFLNWIANNILDGIIPRSMGLSHVLQDKIKC